MFEGLRQGDPLRRLVLEHPLDQVKEEDVVLFIRHLIAFQRLAVFTDVPTGRTLFVPVQPTVVEILGLGLPSHSASNDKRIKSSKVSTSRWIIKCWIIPVGDGTENALHHGQMFPIIVGLKEGHAQVKFKEDAANRPDIARLRPSQFYTSGNNQWQSLII